MDIERLSKSQIILLTLLVSFVTSIATGIVTVTLMEQAPPSIAQTVNRVVERTVEKVVASSQTAGAGTVTERVVVVKESESIASAVSTVSPSVVRLFTTGKDPEGKDIEVFLGLGIVIAGGILTDTAVLPAEGAPIVASLEGGRVRADLVSQDIERGLVLLSGTTTTLDGKPVEWKSAKIATEPSTLGAVVVSISGKDSTRIGNGIVTGVSEVGDEHKSTILDTNVPSGAVAFGSVLIDAFGHVIGISSAASRAVSETAFISAASFNVLITPKTEEGQLNP